VPNHQIGAGVHHGAGESNHVAARFSIVILLAETDMHGVHALCAAMKRHQYQVMIGRQPGNQASSALHVKQ